MDGEAADDQRTDGAPLADQQAPTGAGPGSPVPIPGTPPPVEATSPPIPTAASAPSASPQAATQPPPPPGAALPPPPGPGFTQPPSAPVAWAAPSASPTGLEVPGAPGLRFGSTVARFVAWWIDGILIGIAAALIIGAIETAAPTSPTTSALVSVVIFMGVAFLYFVGLWTGAARATLGMRFMKLQVGNAFDGRTLTMDQAIRRWVGLGLPFQAFTLVPAVSAEIGGLLFLWYLALLISTAISSTRQGLHDRFAGTAVVQPIGASTPATACLVILILLFVLPIIFVAVIFLGSQASTVLSNVGTSV